eukprot:m.351923 g.351923  ORF g.351923 m.351923 type:complete len:169 (+) comp16400_c0_seq1:139-645(+)
MAARVPKDKLLEIWGKQKNIIVGVDGSDCGDAAMDWAITNLMKESDMLHLVYCYQPMDDFVDLEDGIVFSPSAEDQGRIKSAAQARLRDAVKRCVGEEPHIQHTEHLMVGDPRTCINELADTLKAEAVVVGCRGRGAISRAVLGSVSTWLSHHCQRPLVIVRPEEQCK